MEVKNNYARVTTQRILDKFIELNFYVGNIVKVVKECLPNVFCPGIYLDFWMVCFPLYDTSKTQPLYPHLNFFGDWDLYLGRKWLWIYSLCVPSPWIELHKPKNFSWLIELPTKFVQFVFYHLTWYMIQTAYKVVANKKRKNKKICLSF